MRRQFIGLLLVLAFFDLSLGKTINPPKLSAKEAIQLAEQYVVEKKIDTSRHYLAYVEYINLYNEYEKQYWRIEWRLLAGRSLGGEIVVFVYNDRSIKHFKGR
ncbi:MAG: hypothetical protein ABSD46_02405 [Bacteroidota bacterium]